MKHRLSNSWTVGIVCVLFAAFPAKAEELDLAASYRKETQRLIQVMKASGLQSLGYVSPTDVITPDELAINLAAARILVVSSFQKPAASTRQSAFFNREDGTIYLNPAASHPKDMRGVLGLHELFGLRGIPDQNYEFSLLLKLYADRANSLPDSADPIAKGLKAEINSYLLLRAKYPSSDHFRSRNPFDNLLFVGSGTLVGGGGDGNGIALKARLIERVLQEVLPRLPERMRNSPGTISMLIRTVTNMKIEIDSSVAGIAYRSSRADDLAETILVPFSLSEDAAINEILIYMDKVNLIPVPLIGGTNDGR